MNNDPQRASPDDQYIFVNDGDELRHWSQKLRVTPEQLKAAVGAVGHSGVAVSDHLKTLK